MIQSVILQTDGRTVFSLFTHISFTNSIDRLDLIDIFFKINVREYRRGNTNGQTRDTVHIRYTTQYVLDTTIRKKTQITEIRHVQLLDKIGVHRETSVRPSVIGQIISLHVS